MQPVPRSSADLKSGKPDTLVAVVLDHAETQPTRTFLEVWEPQRGILRQATFAEFADQMLAGAHWLRVTSALEAGDYCAFLAHNTIAYLALSLGAMALGATSVNLNWRNSIGVTEVLLENLKPRVLLASRPFKDDASSMHKVTGTRVVLIESICDSRPDQLPFPISPELRSEMDAIAAASRAAATPSAHAAVFFTGGTTGTPKAVPHTHAGLLWVSRELRAVCPAPFAEEVDHRGTICFTPYFHVMGFVANTMFNLVNGCRAAVLASHDAKLSPSLMLAATVDLRPSCVNTVPWVVEGLVAMMADGNADAIDALSRLHLITYGGAALAPHCPPILKKHGVVVACTYGQTELAGPVMYGKPDGDPDALRPFDGVSFELVRGPEDAENEGELVLLGNGSATPGYLTLPSETRQYRSLTGEAASSTTVRFCTGDRFSRVTLSGQSGEWLLYQCRQDDLLVHTSGEMTNPLPIEQQFQAACPSLCSLACCVGDGLTQALLLVEFADASVRVGDPKTRAELLRALEAANRDQPVYSHVKPQHVLLLPPGGLPRTVKGSAQRGGACKQYAAEMEAALRLEGSLPTLAEDMRTLQYDSLALGNPGKSTANPGAPDPNLTHLTGLLGAAALVVLAAHTLDPTSEELFPDVIQRLAGVSMCFFLMIVGMVSQFRITEETMSSGRELLRYYLARLGRVVLSTLLALFLASGFPKLLVDCQHEENTAAAANLTQDSLQVTIQRGGFEWWRPPIASFVASLGLVAAQHATLGRKVGLPPQGALVLCLIIFGTGTVALLVPFLRANPAMLACYATASVVDVGTNALQPQPDLVCPSNEYWFIGEMVVFVLLHPPVATLLGLLDRSTGALGLSVLLVGLTTFVTLSWHLEGFDRWMGRRTLPLQVIDYCTFLTGAVLAALARAIALQMPQLTQQRAQHRLVAGSGADLALLFVLLFPLLMPPSEGIDLISDHMKWERIMTGPAALFLLASGVTYGGGWAARALRGAFLRTVGQAALEVYTLSVGWEYVTSLTGAAKTGWGAPTGTPTCSMGVVPLMSAEVGIIFVGSLLVLAHVVAHYVVQPLISSATALI